MWKLKLLICLSLVTFHLQAQQKSLTYYLPNIQYDKNIPTPESVLGYQIGDWHISHDQQLMYMRQLAATSSRIILKEYARSYENRPLVYLIITSEENHRNLETIQVQHRQLSDPTNPVNINITDQKIVLYQGFSIHGNEPSGGNAAPLVAYYLAAAQSPEVLKLLDEAVIILDPCYNPDGFHRFSTWANMHKNKNLIADPQDREYTEVWPRGRTNHYWFDLNRDWLPVQHPESQGRIHIFHEWKPNVLTDHHEMGTNSSFFFMPGEPTRTNPITPRRNQELTAAIGKFHAKALDKIGSLYYSGEGYDDFYYGKGSTYPDANGCIGILFEQASSRGHLQESVNGTLSFPFTIRNQVKTALSTQEATIALKTELLQFQQEFYQNALRDAQRDPRKAFIFGDAHDLARNKHLVEILQRHQIEVYNLARPIEAGGQQFEPGKAFIVPIEQTQYRLIQGMFETMTSFEDSLFYDISSWTLPLAFNLPYTALDKSTYSTSLLGSTARDFKTTSVVTPPAQSNYGYLFSWDDYYAPEALSHILENGLRAKVSNRAFTSENRQFERGTILVPLQNQEKNSAEIHRIISEAAKESGVVIYGINTGETSSGIDLGSPSFSPLRFPKVLLVVGDGVSSYEAGEVWHLLDQRINLPISMTETDNFNRANLDRYNTIILVDGFYGVISSSGVDKLKRWLQNGGTLITIKRAAQWASSKGLAHLAIKSRSKKENNKTHRPYGSLARDRGSELIGGAIFSAELDLTHPLGYGFHNKKLPVFRRGTLFFEPANNAYATPLIYKSEDALLSGYIKAKNLKKLEGSAAIVVSGIGRGKSISMADNPNFRAFWFGTNKLFLNAIFFGNTINAAATEKSPPKVTSRKLD